MNIKFQEKIFTAKKVISIWNFGNFGIPEIIPKSLVTLRFLKISLHELKCISRCFQMRYWPNFYVDPTYSNTCFFKVGKRRVLLQGTVGAFLSHFVYWFYANMHKNDWNVPSCQLKKQFLNTSLVLYWPSHGIQTY